LLFFTLSPLLCQHALFAGWLPTTFGRPTSDGAQKTLAKLLGETQELTDKLMLAGAINNRIHADIAYNQKADTAFVTRATKARPSGAEVDLSPDNVAEIIEAAADLPQETTATPTAFFAFARRSSDDAKNECERPINLRGLVDTIEDQKDNLKKYKMLGFKTRLFALESDVADAIKKYDNFLDTDVEGSTFADLTSKVQTLHTRLSDEFQYCVQAVYNRYKLNRRKPTIDESRASSGSSKDSQLDEVDGGDKGTLLAMYTSVNDPDTGSKKYFEKKEVPQLTSEMVKSACGYFPVWFKALKTLCNDTAPDDFTVPTNLSTYQDPFNIDLFGSDSTEYYGLPYASTLAAHNILNDYLLRVAQTLRRSVSKKGTTPEKKLFPSQIETADSKTGPRKVETFEGWPTNLFAVLAAYHNKLFLGGFGIVGVRWLLINDVLRDVTKSTEALIMLLGNVSPGIGRELNLSFDNYKTTLTSLCALSPAASQKNTHPSTAALQDASPADATSKMLGILAGQSFYRSWDYVGMDRKNKSAQGARATQLQQKVIDAVKKLSPEQLKQLNTLGLNGLISLSRRYGQHKARIIENSIVAARAPQASELGLICPLDWRAYIELVVFTVAVYNYIALVRIANLGQIYDKDAHDQVRNGDISNSFPALLKRLEAFTPRRATIQEDRSHTEASSAAITGLASLTEAVQRINSYEAARDAKPTSTANIDMLRNAAVDAIVAQLLAALHVTQSTLPTPDASLTDLQQQLATEDRPDILGALTLTADQARLLFRANAVKTLQFTKSLDQLRPHLGDILPTDYTKISGPTDTIIFSLRQTSTAAASSGSSSDSVATGNTYTLTIDANIKINSIPVITFTIVNNDNTPATDVVTIKARPTQTTLRYLVERNNGALYFGNMLLDGNYAPYPPDDKSSVVIVLDALPATASMKEAQQYTKIICDTLAARLDALPLPPTTANIQPPADPGTSVLDLQARLKALKSQAPPAAPVPPADPAAAQTILDLQARLDALRPQAAAPQAVPAPTPRLTDSDPDNGVYKLRESGKDDIILGVVASSGGRGGRANTPCASVVGVYGPNGEPFRDGNSRAIESPYLIRLRGVDQLLFECKKLDEDGPLFIKGTQITVQIGLSRADMTVQNFGSTKKLYTRP